MGKFKFGFSLGALFGAGLLWLNATEKGRKKRDELLEQAGVAYERVKERLMASDAWKKMNENEYAQLVKEVVDKYAIQTGMAANAKRTIEKVLRMRWKSILKELSAEEKE
jgi:gas vesicle protein